MASSALLELAKRAQAHPAGPARPKREPLPLAAAASRAIEYQPPAGRGAAKDVLFPPGNSLATKRHV